MINLQLHGSGIFLMRRVAIASRLVIVYIGGVNTSLMVPPLFKVEEMILTLGPP